MNRLFIREAKMPLTIRAFTVPDENGDYNIYINNNLSDEAKDYLTHAFGDLTIYITNKIEEEVVENKKRDA